MSWDKSMVTRAWVQDFAGKKHRDKSIWARA
jgi:hypothetical protein